MKPQNQDRFTYLSALAPVQAVQACLDGDCRMGDEPALISAIRKDERILLSDEDAIEALCDAIDEGLNAPACLERLARLYD